MMHYPDHDRMKAAYDRIEKWIANFNDPLSTATIQKHRSILRSAATSMHQVGWVNTVTEWLKKKPNDGKSVERQVLQALMTWLATCEDTKWMVQNWQAVDTCQSIQLRALACAPVDLDAFELAILESEAEAYLGWLSRLMEGLDSSLEEQEIRQKKDKDGGGGEKMVGAAHE